MKFFRPIACLLCVVNTCFLIDYIVTQSAYITENPLALALLGIVQIPIVWWFRSRDKEKEKA